MTILSVIVPFKNTEGTLRRAVLAVVEQIHDRPIQLILADNGSTDGSRRIAEELASSHDAIRAIDASSSPGPAAARNVGAAVADGPILAFTDADDIALPGWIDAIIDLPHADNLFASGPVLRFQDGDEPDPGAHSRTVQPMRHMGRPYAGGTNLVMAADLFQRAGGFDTSLATGEDVDLSWRVFDLGASLRFVPELRVAARWRATLRQTLRQYYRYGYGDALLYKRHRRRGASRDGARALARVYTGLLLRLPGLADPRRRQRWAHQAGRRIGRLVGSFRFGVFYP